MVNLKRDLVFVAKLQKQTFSKKVLISKGFNILKSKLAEIANYS
jgi:hypothetical protein